MEPQTLESIENMSDYAAVSASNESDNYTTLKPSKPSFSEVQVVQQSVAGKLRRVQTEAKEEVAESTNSTDAQVNTEDFFHTNEVANISEAISIACSPVSTESFEKSVTTNDLKQLDIVNRATKMSENDSQQLDIVNRATKMSENDSQQLDIVNCATKMSENDSQQLDIVNRATKMSKTSTSSTKLHALVSDGYVDDESVANTIRQKESKFMLHSKDGSGFTPLHLACQNAYFYGIDLLAQHGANVDALDNRLQSPLFSCLSNPAYAWDTMEHLINVHHAHLFTKDHHENTVLHVAVARENLRCVYHLTNLFLDYLISHSAQTQSLSKWLNHDVETPLHIAASASVPAVAAAMTSQIIEAFEAKSQYELLDCLTVQRDVNGKTPYQRATAANNTDAAKILGKFIPQVTGTIPFGTSGKLDTISEESFESSITSSKQNISMKHDTGVHETSESVRSTGEMVENHVRLPKDESRTSKSHIEPSNKDLTQNRVPPTPSSKVSTNSSPKFQTQHNSPNSGIQNNERNKVSLVHETMTTNIDELQSTVRSLQLQLGRETEKTEMFDQERIRMQRELSIAHQEMCEVKRKYDEELQNITTEFRLLAESHRVLLHESEKGRTALLDNISALEHTIIQLKQKVAEERRCKEVANSKLKQSLQDAFDSEQRALQACSQLQDTQNVPGDEDEALLINRAWQMYHDENQRVYYYNHDTGESSWSPPQCTPPVNPTGSNIDFSIENHSIDAETKEEFEGQESRRNFHSNDTTPGKQLTDVQARIWSRFIENVGNRATINERTQSSQAESDANKLLHAVETMNLEVVRKAVLDGIAVDTFVGEQGNSLLHVCASTPSSFGKGFVTCLENDTTNPRVNEASVVIEMASLLIDCGCDVDLSDVHGTTPLHHAAANGNAVLTEYLLQCAADVTLYDDNKENALHMAAGASWTAGHVKCVQLLLKYEAPFNAVNVESQTPLDVARECLQDAMTSETNFERIKLRAMEKTVSILTQVTGLVEDEIEEEYLPTFVKTVTRPPPPPPPNSEPETSSNALQHNPFRMSKDTLVSSNRYAATPMEQYHIVDDRQEGGVGADTQSGWWGTLSSTVRNLVVLNGTNSSVTDRLSEIDSQEDEVESDEDSDAEGDESDDSEADEEFESDDVEEGRDSEAEEYHAYEAAAEGDDASKGDGEESAQRRDSV